MSLGKARSAPTPGSGRLRRPSGPIWGWGASPVRHGPTSRVVGACNMPNERRDGRLAVEPLGEARGASPFRRTKRGGSGALVGLLSATVLGLMVPTAHAAPATHLGGTVIPLYFNTTSIVNKSNKTYISETSFVEFTGDISGTCSGSDNTVYGLGPHNASNLTNPTGFVRDVGSCVFVGSVAGYAGTLQLLYESQTGFHTCAGCTTDFHFSAGNGTGELASAHLTEGVLTTASNYTARLQIG